ncbi:MAG: hypothetical protein AAB676_06765 [Verrucomicrobiota bacterium]
MDWKREPEPKSLSTGTATLRDARVPVRIEAHRDRMLAVKRGERPWAEVDAWRKELHTDFERALAETKLPERPDYEAANCRKRRIASLSKRGGKWQNKISRSVGRHLSNPDGKMVRVANGKSKRHTSFT